MERRSRAANMPKAELERRCADGSMYADFVPIGKWENVDGAWECSLCGCRKPDDTAFCPNCGADMRENIK